MKQKMLDKFGDIKDKISNVFTDEKLQQKMTSLQYTFSELNQDTSTIPSLYYDTTSQKITKKTNGVIFIALVSFHQKKGSIVEYTYPSKEAILSSQTDFFDSLKRIEGDKQIDVSNEEILNDIENQLSAFCLPDGIHVVNRDTEFFIIQNYNKVLYCTFSYRQIRTNDNNNIIDDFQENTRDCVQKSLCIISTVPLFMYYYEKINVAMDLFMNQKILNDKSAIDSLYKDIAEKKESISMKYFKFYNFFSYRKLIQFINDDLIVLLKYAVTNECVICLSPLVNSDSSKKMFANDFIQIIKVEQSLLAKVIQNLKSYNSLIDFHERSLNYTRKPYMLTQCNHAFHTQCLETWFKRKRECPNCRSEISSNYSSI